MRSKPPAAAQSAGTAPPPIDAACFAALMAPFAPFEPQPLLAVAVSGGADSLALALMAAEWARAQGGVAVALTVDHQLRAGSATEAAQVGAWLAARGIRHEILRRGGPAPRSDIEAAARALRYSLLEEWCRAQGCLHLLLAHHREDQAETLLLRLGRGSGVDGLAAMPALQERAHCRLVRPLLGVPAERLRRFLAAAGQAWIEDPSNRDPRFMRNRLRQSAPFLAEAGLGAERLAATARHLGRARAALEAATDTLLARAAALDPAGFVRLDPTALAQAPAELRLRALARLLMTVGGNEHPPRLERLERLATRLGTASATLAGCRIVRQRGALVLCREEAACEAPVTLPPGVERYWDGRFRARLATAAPPGLSLGALGSENAARLARNLAMPAIPAVVRPSLPAIWDLEGVLAVPHLRFVRSGARWKKRLISTLVFRPQRALTRAGFTVV